MTSSIRKGPQSTVEGDMSWLISGSGAHQYSNNYNEEM